jgi:hypothetical protein
MPRVISRVDDQLRDEARRFKLVFACPSCVWFEVDGRACALGFPNADHVDERLEGRESVIFCKAFELA